MKKKIAIVAVIAGLGLAGIAQAQGGWGQQRYGGGQFYDCPRLQGPGAARMIQADPAAQEKLEAFFADTQDLRKQMAMKQAEKRALMRGDNPDPGAVSRLTGELFDLRAAIQTKAAEAGISELMGPGRGGFGPGGPGGKGWSGRGGRGMQGGGPGSGPGYGPGNGPGRF